MSELKLEIRKQTAQDIGTRVEDRLEATKLEVARAEGASDMALRLQKQVEILHAHVDKDVEAGKFEDLRAAQQIKDWITRAGAVCGSGAQIAANTILVSKGKLQGLEDALKIVANEHQGATKRLALFQLATAEEEGPPPPKGGGNRAPGERPRASVRARRTREAQQDSAPLTGETPPVEAAEAVDLNAADTG